MNDPLQTLVDHYDSLKLKHRRREHFRRTVLLPARTQQLKRECPKRRRGKMLKGAV